VDIGDPVVFGEDFRELYGGFATHRAFDNRMGCFVVAEVLRQCAAKSSRSATIYGVSSVQEETGVWGAGLVAQRYLPTLAIAVDVTHDTTTPGITAAAHPEVVCGKGPVIARGIRARRILTELLEKAARTAMNWSPRSTRSASAGGSPVPAVSRSGSPAHDARRPADSPAL
jgi:endoglucanase